MARTLYEDWQLRREHLNHAEALPHFEEQAKVFDFLLSRYEDNPSAQQPAKFPMSTELFLNTRAILVHHRLQYGEFAGTQSKADAELKMRTLLGRISAKEPQANIGTPSSRINLVAPDLDASGTDRHLKDFSNSRFMNYCKSLLANGGKLGEADARHLRDLFCRKMFGWDSGDSVTFKDVMDIIEKCRDLEFTQYLLLFWRPNDQDSDIQQQLEMALRSNERGALIIREELMSSDCFERERAAKKLGKLGTLDDIGLLQDLLALPEMKVDSAERRAYLKAMKNLSESPVK